MSSGSKDSAEWRFRVIHERNLWLNMGVSFLPYGL